jgi:hypothetical protein
LYGNSFAFGIILDKSVNTFKIVVGGNMPSDILAIKQEQQIRLHPTDVLIQLRESIQQMIDSSIFPYKLILDYFQYRFGQKLLNNMFLMHALMLAVH